VEGVLQFGSRRLAREMEWFEGHSEERFKWKVSWVLKFRISAFLLLLNSFVKSIYSPLPIQYPLSDILQLPITYN
jgi:hypothetical protein